MATKIIPDLSFKRGDTVKRRLLMNAKSGVLDFTGSTAKMNLRDATGTLLLDMTPFVTLDNAVIDPTTPWIKAIWLIIPFASTDLPTGVHRTDLEITWADGTRSSSRTLYFEVLQDETYA